MLILRAIYAPKERPFIVAAKNFSFDGGWLLVYYVLLGSFLESSQIRKVCEWIIKCHKQKQSYNLQTETIIAYIRT